jgi:hypothetical protein
MKKGEQNWEDRSCYMVGIILDKLWLTNSAQSYLPDLDFC